MIRCDKCGYVGAYLGPECPECKEKFNLTPDEIDSKIQEIREAERKKHYETAAEGHHLLADLGRAESQIRYAEMLTRGDGVMRDPDTAMIYYRMAAENNSPSGAYKYSRMAEKCGDRAASFWLSYAAALGCVEAYPTAAKMYADRGEDELANFYYAMAAAYDVTDAIVSLAKRYYTGIGAEQNLPYAKWYMDKLLIPPLHAIKIAYKLRSVKAEDPGIPKHPDSRRMLRRLSVKAKELGLYKQHHRLSSMLRDEGDTEAITTLGTLYVEGKGAQKDLYYGLALLEDAASKKSARAYRYLADLYLKDEILPRDTDKAITYYQAAAELGMTDLYEIVADIFHDGKIVTRDVARAIELYTLGGKRGHSSARAKADKLTREREDLYKLGIRLRTSSPEQSFRAFAVSASMGYVPAYKEMARAFLLGNGIKKDRQQAYLWFEKAVDSKDESALYELGLCFSRGIGTHFDYKKAVEILAKATRLGSKEARAELERIMTNKRRHMIDKVYSKAMSLIYQKKLKAAIELLMTAEKFGHAMSIYTLACLCEFGLGTPTDRDRAFALYEKSFALMFRDPRAVYKLKVLKMARL